MTLEQCHNDTVYLHLTHISKAAGEHMFLTNLNDLQCGECNAYMGFGTVGFHQQRM